jgi:hypothetical protein
MKKPSKKNRVAQTMSQAAKLLGVELSTLKLAKRNGCDAFLRSGRVDLTKARKWLADNPNGAPASENGHGKAVPMAPVDLSDVEKSLAAAISVEEKNLQLLRAAQDRNDPVAVQALSDAFQKSQKNRLSYERAVREELIRSGELVSREKYRMDLFKICPPIISRFRAMARKAAMQVAGTDEATALQVLEKEVEAVIAELHAACVSLESTFSDSYFNCWLIGILEDDRAGGPNALERIDAARARVIAALAAVRKPEMEPAK